MSSINRCYTVLPQFPDYTVSISLFEDVSNAQELRSKVAELPFALIDARAICSREQLLSAIYRALVEVSYNKRRTKSLHSECLLCLSPSSNIGEAFKNFGLKDDCKTLIAVQILGPNDQNAVERLGEEIHGREVELLDQTLQQHCDETFIRKVCGHQR
ncbi:hypothetical protein HG536_0A06020 [Torulaspora globosa]|uniref:EKC/KEOPS complex subunit CGI121 n=1 Tax=Torulaspora globosa TaxID=48254 RepID=A0A7G3ZBA1_9SACH|nr:uncharacterized protein HG536_0A06020 [Torulaspora globosa]QLL30787.1 hypothetical protein HG536_0A06020 [Torulaspora globosa]